MALSVSGSELLCRLN